MGDAHRVTQAMEIGGPAGLSRVVVAAVGWPILSATTVMLCGLAWLAWVQQLDLTLLIVVVNLVLLAPMGLLLKLGRYGDFVRVYLATAMACASVVVTAEGGLLAPDVGALYTLIAVTAVLAGSRGAMLATALVCALVCLFGVAELLQGPSAQAAVPPWLGGLRAGLMVVLTGVTVWAAGVALEGVRTRLQRSDRARQEHAPALERSAQVLELVDRYLPGLLWISAPGRMELVGGEWEQVTGLASARLQAEPEALLALLADEVRDGMSEVLERPTRWPESLTLRCVEGTRIMQVRSAALGIDHLEMAVLVDVTDERLQAVRQARRASALEGRQQLEAVGRLASGVAHDVRNLLTVVRALSDMVRPQLAPVQQQDLLEVSAACDRAAVLTRDLLLVSRKDRGQDGLYSLDRAIEGTVALGRRVMPLEVSREGPSAGVLVRGEPEALELFLFSVMAACQAVAHAQLEVSTRRQGAAVLVRARATEPLVDDEGWLEVVGSSASLVDGVAVLRLDVAEELPDVQPVWLVEPDDLVAKVVTRALKRDGLEVRRIADREQERSSAPCLILSDVTGASGASAADRLAQEHPDVPLLRLSFDPGPGKLAKPFNTKDLRRTVAALLQAVP